MSTHSLIRSGTLPGAAPGAPQPPDADIDPRWFSNTVREIEALLIRMAGERNIALSQIAAEIEAAVFAIEAEGQLDDDRY